jgi:hypothetical protein
MLVVGFTGMVTERAAASTPLELRVIGDNLGDPDDPGDHYHYFNIYFPFTDMVVRAVLNRLSTSHLKPNAHEVNQGTANRAR